MKLKQRILSAVTAAAMLLTSQAATLPAFAADAGAGKYVS